MKIDIGKWMRKYTEAVSDCFCGRIRFIGLQGSYARGEATESSDIDAVLILDRLDGEDVEKYGRTLDTLPERDKICGFLCGEEELKNWERADLFQLCFDTEPVLGTLDGYIKMIGESDIRRAVRLGACNIYHMCVHNMLYEKNAEILKGLFKSAFFTLRAKAYLETGRYEMKKTALLSLLSPEDLVISDTAEKVKKLCLWDGKTIDASEKLLAWASEYIKNIAGDGLFA